MHVNVIQKFLRVRTVGITLGIALSFGLWISPATVLAATPTVANIIANQNATIDTAFNFSFASNTFNDQDGDSLTYTSQLEGGGALPAWLSFDPVTRTFSGTPTNGDLGNVSIDVIASDGNGGSVTDTFNILITAVPASTCETYNMTTGAGGVCEINDCFDDLFSWAASPDEASMARTYRLTTSIICPGDMTTTPIGSDTLQFTGTFDGGSHTIQYLNIDGSGGWNTGLFSNAYGATFKDLSLDYANISPHGYTGSLVGIAAEGTSIKNVRANGIYINSTGGSGGLVGQLIESTISYSSVTGSQIVGNGQEHGGLVGSVIGAGNLSITSSYVSNTSVEGGGLVGGLIGSLDGAIISNVYAQAALTVPTGVVSGGLVGYAADATISNTYAAGSITGANFNSTGGLIGDIDSGVTIENSFAAVTGFSVYAFYGTSDAEPPVLINNFYQPGIANNQVCFSGTDGSEPNCGYDDGGVAVGNWLDTSRQPTRSWDTWHTWNLFPSSGSYPTLVAEGGIANAPFDGGNGQASTPYLISDCRQLQHMRDNLSAFYKLNAATVDCSETVDWFDGKGFEPIGDNSDPAPFTGNFDGNGHTISNLYINRVNDTPGEQDEDESFVGLFGYIQGGSAYAVNLTNAKVRGFFNVGGLVGMLDNGAVAEVNVNTAVADNDCLVGGHCVWARYGSNGGGIVGTVTNVGTILDSNSGGPVKGSGVIIGGIVGRMNDGSILTDATASGDVLVQTDFGKAGENGGGAVGSLIDSTITNVNASGDVYGLDALGGLVGYVDGSTISDSTASGSMVEGNSVIGGFAGLFASSIVSNSNSTTEAITSIDSNAGGFAGLALCGSTFTDSSSSTDVAGFSSVGGFVGSDGCQGVGANYTNVSATGNVDGYQSTGGLIGFSAISTIDQSFATGDVTSVFTAGGLIGEVYGFGRDDPDFDSFPARISESYATGDVSATSGSTGGLVGDLNGAVISDSYARGDVYSGDSAGGITGSADDTSAIQHSYSTGVITSDIMAPQGVTGSFGLDLLVTDSFWDSTINPSLDASSGFGAGLSTADLQKQSVLEDAGFSFSDIWGFSTVDNDGYACLQWTSEQCTTQIESPATPVYTDLNGDNIADVDQPNIGGYVNSSTSKLVAMDMGQNCELTTDDMASEASLPVQDAAYQYDNGLFDFEAECSSSQTTIKLYYYDVSKDSLTLRKFSTKINGYFTINEAVLTQETINGHSVAVATYLITDNGNLDMNDQVGIIADPAGLARNILGSPNTGLGL